MSRYIDAEEVKHIMNEHIEKTGNDIFTRFHVTDFLNEADSKDIVKIVHAKWETGRCTNCLADKPVLMASVVHGYISRYQGKLNYCPNCGAKIEEEL